MCTKLCTKFPSPEMVRPRRGQEGEEKLISLPAAHPRVLAAATRTSGHSARASGGSRGGPRSQDQGTGYRERCDISDQSPLAAESASEAAIQLPTRRRSVRLLSAAPRARGGSELKANRGHGSRAPHPRSTGAVPPGSAPKSSRGRSPCRRAALTGTRPRARKNFQVRKFSLRATINQRLTGVQMGAQRIAR